MKKYILLLLTIFIISNCNNSNLKKTPENQFIGTWELKGRKMFDGVNIKIERNKDERLIGRVIK